MPLDPVTGAATDWPVRLRVADVAGRVVAVLAEGRAEPGRHSVEWEGASHGRPLGAGLYFVRWESPGVIEQKRLVVIR